MIASRTLWALLTSLLMLVQFVIGVPLVSVTEAGIPADNLYVYTHSPSVIVLDSNALNDASETSVVARNIVIAPNKYLPDPKSFSLENSTTTHHTINSRDGPFGACFNAFSEGGKQGEAVHDICMDFGGCAVFAPWKPGGVRSMGFRGATVCFLYTTENCTGNKLLSVNEDSPGVKIKNGREFRLGGPWLSAQCSRAW